MATCRSCDAEIEWAQTEARGDKPGKKMPLDADPVKLAKDRAEGDKSTLGNLVVVSHVASEYGMTPVVRYVKAGAGTRLSHFATCPDRATHRKGK